MCVPLVVKIKGVQFGNNPAMKFLSNWQVLKGFHFCNLKVVRMKLI